MANIAPRRNKNGEITSYTIRVYHGYDSEGNRLKPYTMSYKPAPGMTAKQIERELNKTVVMFEEQCRQGITLDKVDEIKQFIAIEKNVKGIDASGNAYKICECLSDEIPEYVCNILNFFRDIQ